MEREAETGVQTEDWFQRLYSGAWKHENESIQDIEESVYEVKREIIDGLYLTKMTDLRCQAILGSSYVLLHGTDWAFQDPEDREPEEEELRWKRRFHGKWHRPV